jgi:hypothetical protein
MPVTVADAPLEQATLLMVLSEANEGMGYAGSALHRYEKDEIVEPGQEISKGPTREEAFPLEKTRFPDASKNST